MNTINTSKEIRTRRKIESNELVTIMNVSQGEVFYTSKKTGLSFTMVELGSTIDIEFDELKTMRASNPRYLTYPFIAIVGDNAEDVIAQLGLQSVYEYMVLPEEVNHMLDEMSIDQFKETLKKLAEGVRVLLIGTMRERVEAGTFDSFAKIQAVEEMMGITIIDR